MRQLNQAEEAFTIVNSVYPFTLVCILRLGSSPGEEILSSALKELQAIYPFLSVSIRGKKDHYRFERDPDKKPVPLEVLRRKSEEGWKEAARLELNKAFDQASSPLVRAVYYKSQALKDDSEIILSFHHAIIDAASFLPMCSKLLLLMGDGITKAGRDDPASGRLITPSPRLKDVMPPTFREPVFFSN